MVLWNLWWIKSLFIWEMSVPGRSQIAPKPTGTPRKGNSEPEFLKNVLPVSIPMWSVWAAWEVSALWRWEWERSHQEVMSDPSWVTPPARNRISALMEKTTLSKVNPTGVFALNSPEPGSGDTDLINWSWTKPQDTPGFSSCSSLWGSLCDL